MRSHPFQGLLIRLTAAPLKSFDNDWLSEWTVKCSGSAAWFMAGHKI